MKPIFAPAQLLRLHLLASVFAALSAFAAESLPPLLEARRGVPTRLQRKESFGEVPDAPPAGVLNLVSYAAPLGKNRAYVSPDPGDGKKHPAIIWLTGGFSNSISDNAWAPAPPSNDQSAAGFRRAGLLMMYPSLRGGNDNPGFIEACYGEVDDVLAAANYLAGLPYIDSARIYLGGHSTGGTLTLLVAAAAGNRFRAAFALGPVDDVTGYGQEPLPFDVKDSRERQLRAPSRWINGIRFPTYVFEGTKAPGNIASLRALEKISANPFVHFTAKPGETHFTIIAPLVTVLTKAILADNQGTERFSFDFDSTK